MFTTSFLSNWDGKNNSKISKFHIDPQNTAKFYYSNNLEVFMTFNYDSIAVAVSSDKCTFAKTWKEKGITLEEIKSEIDNFLNESEKKLLN